MAVYNANYTPSPLGVNVTAYKYFGLIGCMTVFTKLLKSEEGIMLVVRLLLIVQGSNFLSFNTLRNELWLYPSGFSSVPDKSSSTFPS